MVDSDFYLPNPPELGQMKIPMYFEYIHPYTKWMINMIRGDMNHRLCIMIKERPELFQQIYQIPDIPHVVLNDKYDRKSVFHQSSVLYLNPLCLAIYMKRIKSVEILIQSGVNSLEQKGYATEVYKRGVQSGGDIHELMPITISIGREFFTCLPVLLNGKINKIYGNLEGESCDLNQSISFAYENIEGKKTYKYKNLLNYALSILRKRGNFPLASFVDVLINTSENFKKICSTLSETDNKSVFRKLAETAYYTDLECRISLQIIRSLEIILKSNCYPWNPVSPRKHDLLNRLKSNSINIHDQDCSIGILLALFNRIYQKRKNGALDYLGQLLSKTLEITQWRDVFLECRIDELYEYFINLPEQLNISCETIASSRRLVKSIVDLERERDMNSDESDDSGIKKMRHKRRACTKLKGRKNSIEVSHLSKSIPIIQVTNSSNISTSKFKNLPSAPTTIFSYKTPSKDDNLKVSSISQTSDEREFESDSDSRSLSKLMDGFENSSGTNSSVSASINIQHTNNQEVMKRDHSTQIASEVAEISNHSNIDLVQQCNEKSELNENYFKTLKSKSNTMVNSLSKHNQLNDKMLREDMTLDQELENLLQNESDATGMNAGIIESEILEDYDTDSELSEIDLVNYEDKIIQEMCGEYLNPFTKSGIKNFHFNVNQRLDERT